MLPETLLSSGTQVGMVVTTSGTSNKPKSYENSFKWSQDRGFNLFLVLVGLWSHVETSRLILRDASDETQISGHQRSEKFRLISVLGSFAQF